jgi:serine/threonine protein kinase
VLTGRIICAAVLLPCSSEFKQVKELGRGGFSIVFRATHRIDVCEYALKRTKNPVSDNKDRNAWLQVSTGEWQQLAVLWATCGWLQFQTQAAGRLQGVGPASKYSLAALISLCLVTPAALHTICLVVSWHPTSPGLLCCHVCCCRRCRH